MVELKSYRVWDAPTRWFHWVNALSVIALVIVGYLILNGRLLEIPRTGSLKLKVLHTWIGYVFVINLLIRLAWSFLGNRYARWGAILPGGRGYLSATWSYVKAFFTQHPQHYLGHNPIGRLSVAVMFALLVALAVSGIVLAGTDLFYPPLGSSFARWVAAPGVDPATLVPGASELVDKTAFDAMRSFRRPFILTHLYVYYALLAVGALHILGVVVTEIREGGTMISATFTGRKLLSEPPVDEEPVRGV
jgi:cytochrome b